MTIKNITSLNNEEIKSIYKKLNSSNHEFISIESQKVFDQIKDEIYLDYLVCTQDWYDKNKNHKYQVNNILIVNYEIIKKLSFNKNTNTEVIYIFNYQLREFKIEANQQYVIFDNIQDPNNLATMIRTAVAFNITNIFINKNGVNPLNNKVIRSSVGSIFKINVIFYDDLKSLITKLKNHYKYKIIASCLDKESIKLNNFSAPKSFCLIMGNEGNGINKNIINMCDYKLMIDINNIDSLNVSNAFSILIFWLTK